MKGFCTRLHERYVSTDTMTEYRYFHYQDSLIVECKKVEEKQDQQDQKILHRRSRLGAIVPR